VVFEDAQLNGAIQITAYRLVNPGCHMVTKILEILKCKMCNNSACTQCLKKHPRHIWL